MQPHINRRTVGGFTLIELLVVVAIIALLISILLPSLTQARQTARMIKCQAILKQMGSAHHMYANEAEEWFVPNYLSDGRFWIMNIKYRANLGLRAQANGLGLPDGLLCPQLPETHKAFQRRTNYGVNNTRVAATSTATNRPRSETNAPWKAGDYNPTDNTTFGSGNGIRLFRAKVRVPSQRVHMSDGCDWLVERAGAQFDHGQRWDYMPETNASAATNEAGGGLWGSVGFRHSDGANLLMFDGHAEYRQKNLVWVTNPDGTVNNTATDDVWFQYK